jgi:DNA-binding Lrp family transcriptional regulator
MALAIALDADDVFLRTITVPEGLDDAQLEQVAIVEAVSNLPVPPEEICLDFTRVTSDDHDELIGIAFCRRERIDEILACAEEVNIPVHVVDRDVQAIHDAIADKALSEDVVIKYPFCIVLTEVSPRIIICLGPTDFEVYPIRMPLNDIEDSYTSLLTQVGNCWTRCRMSRSIIPDALERLFMVGNVASKVKWPPINPEASVSKQMDILIMNESVEIAPANSFVPDEIVLIALGMSQRRLA